MSYVIEVHQPTAENLRLDSISKWVPYDDFEWVYKDLAEKSRLMLVEEFPMNFYRITERNIDLSEEHSCN